MDYSLLYRTLVNEKNIDVDKRRERDFAKEHPRLYFTIQMIRKLSILERVLEAQLRN